MTMTTRKRHSPEQVVRKLATADRMLGEGKDVADVCRELQVAEQTYYRWRNQFGGLKADDAKRLKELERENSTLKTAAGRCRAGEGRVEGDRPRETSKPGTPAGGRRSPHQGTMKCERTVRLSGDRAEPNNAATSSRSSTTVADPGRGAAVSGCGTTAKTHPAAAGFRPAYHDARGEGWNVNHKKIQRLWREEGLRVPQRRRRKRHRHLHRTRPCPKLMPRTGSGPSTSNSTPPPTAGRSRSCRSSTSTPANAWAGWSNAPSPPTP